MMNTEMAAKKDKILIVDDEDAIREMLGYTLMKEGYTCIEAGDVDAAREHIKSEKPGLILLDWMLPGTSGIDYAERLGSVPKTKDIPIIMLTATGDKRHTHYYAYRQG